MTPLSGLAALLVRLAPGILRHRAPPRLTLKQRLAMLPADGPGLDGPITLRWSDHHIPFIQAHSHADAAFGLGIVHGHLRLAQISAMRLVSQGRLSEIGGAAAIEVDRILRLIDFPRAAADSLAMMPPATRLWVRRFADGLNRIVADAAADERRLPPDLALLGHVPQPFDETDIFAITRLASLDYTWKIWRHASRERGAAYWDTLWGDLTGVGAVAEAAGQRTRELPEDPEEETAAIAGQAMETFGRHGSNAFALAGSRTRTGKPLLGCDPHHMITAPCLWLVAGLTCPTMTATGLMVPGVPVFGLGRNTRAAWVGTSLHGMASELVDVGGSAPTPLSTRQVTLDVRWRGPHTLTLRESPHGPVIGDSAMFASRPSETLALHWMGHRPSDDVTSFLDMARAESWEAFVEACDRHALPGLNMIYGDESGRIGQLVAARLPQRPLSRPDDMISRPDAMAHWEQFVSARQMPMRVDPPEGFLASANDPVEEATVSVGHFFAPPHRIARLRALLQPVADADIATAARLHGDVYSALAHRLARHLATLMGQAAQAASAHPRDRVVAAIARILSEWDGTYDGQSQAAVVFEKVTARLGDHLRREGQLGPSDLPVDHLMRLERALLARPRDQLIVLLRAAAHAAAPAARRRRRWAQHLSYDLAHPLARLPGLRRAYTFAVTPASGSNETLLKSAHPTDGRAHRVKFGANSRFVADLADRDNTRVVLLGGQDGWVGSTTTGDQAPLFQRHETLALPLSPDAVARLHPHQTVIRPAAPGAGAAGGGSG